MAAPLSKRVTHFNVKLLKQHILEALWSLCWYMNLEAMTFGNFKKWLTAFVVYIVISVYTHQTAKCGDFRFWAMPIIKVMSIEVLQIHTRCACQLSLFYNHAPKVVIGPFLEIVVESNPANYKVVVHRAYVGAIYSTQMALKTKNIMAMQCKIN